jgi:hypothetical protein
MEQIPPRRLWWRVDRALNIVVRLHSSMKATLNVTPL